MRLANFSDASGQRLGVIVDFPDAPQLADVAELLAELPRDLCELLPQLEAWRSRLQNAADHAPRLALKTVELLAPVPRPRHFFAAGLNYADHAREMGIALPPRPRLFTKLPGTIQSPFGSVHHPEFSDTLDYEGELALIVARKCRNVPQAAAHAHIGGYMIVNDLSLRALVNQDTLVLGKGCDEFAPQGPWLTTTEEVPNARALRIRTWVNGELRQDGSTRDLVFGPAELLAYCSRGITLEAGDIISTGSPPGSGHGMRPPRYLTPGDRVRIEIDGLGRIENLIAHAATDPAAGESSPTVS